MWTHLDLFSGIGGFALACEWAGIETIGFVEIDKFCQKVLRKHWPDVPVVEDIHDIEKIKQVIANAQNSNRRRTSSPDYTGRRTSETRGCVMQSGARQRDRKLHTTVDLITGGFPCQPFSVAGKQRGTADDRYVWPAMLNVIKELKPTWVIGENVAGIINMELNNVLSDLENAGYEVQPFVIPACAVNAPHRRDRVWIIAHCNGTGNRASASGTDKDGQTTSKESEQPQLEHIGQNFQSFVRNLDDANISCKTIRTTARSVRTAAGEGAENRGLTALRYADYTDVYTHDG